MPPSFAPGPASATVFVHALGIAIASVGQGLYATAMAGWGGWTFMDGSEPVLGFILAGYGLFRVLTFLIGVVGSLVVLLSANSLRQGHKRFVLIGGLVALGLPFGMLLVDMTTFNCCTLWYLPALSAIPAAVVLFDALPTAPPAPPREEW